MATRSPDHVVEKRIKEVRDHLLVGKSRSWIVRHCSSKWKVSSRQIDTYLKRAYEQFREDHGADDFERRLAMRHDLYERALAAGQIKTAHQILQDLDELYGRYKRDLEPTTGPTSIIFKVSDGNDDD